MFWCIPENITKDGIDKTFVEGYVDIVSTIEAMSQWKNKLSTVHRILQLSNYSWPPTRKYFLQDGGRLEDIYKGIIKTAKCESWEWVYTKGLFNVLL